MQVGEVQEPERGLCAKSRAPDGQPRRLNPERIGQADERRRVNDQTEEVASAQAYGYRFHILYKRPV